VTASAATPDAGQAGRQQSGLRARLTPVNVVIAAMTLLALGLRLFYLTRPGYLLGVTEYDDGSYFGSAVRLVHGMLPYRDFVFVQPPGITLLMTPVALLARVTGTDWGLALARIATMLVGAAGVALAGLLVRHRGVLAALIACGVVAIYPDSVASAHTLLVEPWLVLFCLAGAVAVFDGDRITGSSRRLIWGGVAFGFAGVIEAWAIIPVLVIVLLGLRWPRRMAFYAGGVAAGFLIPVLPFAALAPRMFYKSVIVAQVGGRVNAARMPLWYRLREMSGFANDPGVRHLYILAVIAGTIAFVIVACVLASLLTRRLPPALEWFAYLTTAAVVGIFLWPAQFHYHFSGFLAPFIGLSIALPAARLVAAVQSRAAGAGAEAGASADAGAGAGAGAGAEGSPAGRARAEGSGAGQLLSWCAVALAVALIAAGTWSQATFESKLYPSAPVAMMAAGERIIPPGACVLADNSAYTLVANRFLSNVPGCPVIDDGTGANYALSNGRSALTGAGQVPAVAALWHSAFAHAQYVWLTSLSRLRIPWTPALTAYFHANFVRVPNHTHHLRLYVRKGLHPR
jgi:hypothetical protein